MFVHQRYICTSRDSDESAWRMQLQPSLYESQGPGWSWRVIDNFVGVHWEHLKLIEIRLGFVDFDD